ncbi:MAG: hypothetical protein R6V28_06350 [Nitriliruptoraceae bacterium]
MARGGGTIAAIGAGGMLATAALVRAGRHLGAAPSEVAARLPGDRFDPAATRVTTRAIEIPAPPSEVWPWLVQMGYRRGGWYAIDALERLIGAGDFLTGGSAQRIVPELQDLAVGDRVALNDRAHLVVAHLEAPRALVLVLPGGPLAWVWSFNLHGGTHTRLIVRCRTGARTRWMRWLLPLLEAGHLVMELVQLRRLRARVAGATSAARV